MSDATLGGRFKRWFWRPPRPHGETIADRTVSVLELFYDLVYVADISQAAHHLTEHVTVRGVADFSVGLGYEHARTRVVMLIADLDVRVINAATGEEVVPVVVEVEVAVPRSRPAGW